MVAGQGTKDHHDARLLAYRDPDAFAALLHGIAELTVEYLVGQAEAGVEAVQLFDSWAGSLSTEHKGSCVVEPTKWLVGEFKKRCPDVPVIGFPRGIGSDLGVYAKATGIDAIGLDETTSIQWADEQLPPGMAIQGNIDPIALEAGGEPLERAVTRLLRDLPERPLIINLGHGIGQHTPIAHVERLLELVRGWQG
jgi:uroporphyrinogen decarboxylase